MSDHDEDDEAQRQVPTERVAPVLDRLFHRIDNREKLHQVHLDIVAMRGDLRQMTATVDVMGKTVFGNGAPGLKTDVDRLVRDMLDRRWRERVLWGMALTTLSGVVLLIIQMFMK